MNARIEQLTKDLWQHVFNMIENEPDADSDLAGSVASAVSNLFAAMLSRELGQVTPDQFRAHLDRATAEVKMWPEWKQNLLG